ncbi:NAD(P)-dependent oxidoreductase [Brevundimonas sp.]|uniref:NAD-dependent epimerase/dehydratase family protein n=1 Tax=Brevundimonas sp. TaxID=1871086 RepID=UPI0025E1E2BF|nr:NAD(P)-dependent oxidoreductase [Brevundimonas sp.]
MRVLVTGATGFLGGRVVAALVARGDEVVATGRAVDRAPGGVSFVQADLAGAGAPERLQTIGRVDAVVHAAALSSPWGPWPAFRRANVEGTDAALAAARRLEARRFVFVSSPSVAFRFADQFGVLEADPLPKPVNAYARSKQAAEERVLAARDVGPIVLRPRGLYGAGDTALLPRLIRAARSGPLPLLRDGQARTDLTHVDDVAAAVIAALDAPSEAEGAVFNVSGGEALSVVAVAETAAARAGVAVRWRSVPVAAALAAARTAETLWSLAPGRPEPPITAYGIGLFAYSQTLDLTAARERLGWSPGISWEEGLDRTFRSAP